MTIFKLPDLGEGLPDAEIHEWYVAEGDLVKIDQPLVAMETAKAVVDIPSPVSGRIKKLHGKPKDIIQTGAPLIEFASEKTSAKQDKKSKDTGTVVGVIETSDTVLVESPTGVAVQKRTSNIKATPVVRMLATTLQVDLNKIQGTGLNGVITADDVKKASTATTSTQFCGETLHGARRTMAQYMAQSHAQVVSVTLMEDADLHQWLDKTDVTLRLIQAIIAACKTEPSLNAHFYGDILSRKLYKEINLAIAVDTPAGLYTPVIKDAANQSAAQLRKNIDTFKNKAKTQSFAPSDLQNATITLSNFGTISGRYANPIIVPPTVAIIGIGKTRPVVVAANGKPAVHLIMPISLSFDHRAATGGEAARFMAALIESLEKA